MRNPISECAAALASATSATDINTATANVRLAREWFEAAKAQLERLEYSLVDRELEVSRASREPLANPSVEDVD